MNGFLLDTDTVSLLSPKRRDKDDAFIHWLSINDDVLFLSAITIHEISRGIASLRNKGATAKAQDLQNWLDVLTLNFGDRILPIDAATAALAGHLEAEALAAGHQPGMADAAIAATAKLHGLTVVTRNLRHFHRFPVPAQSPSSLSA